MIPTYVFGWPTGEETGDFLAVDLGTFLSICSRPCGARPHSHRRVWISSQGGTNLRVCLVTLQGKGKFEITQSKYRLTEEQKQEDGQKLFDFCAECLKTFIETNLGEGAVRDGEKLPLGFTVSTLFLTGPCKVPYRLAGSAREFLISDCADYLDVKRPF
jgi:hexokinase